MSLYPVPSISRQSIGDQQSRMRSSRRNSNETDSRQARPSSSSSHSVRTTRNDRRHQQAPPFFSAPHEFYTRVDQVAPQSNSARRRQDAPPYFSAPHEMLTRVDDVAILDARRDSNGSRNSRERVRHNTIQEDDMIFSDEDMVAFEDFYLQLQEDDMIFSDENMLAFQDMIFSDENMLAFQDMFFLEEQTREMKSGWSEEAILKSLKTRTHKISQETELCTICQDGFEVDEKIGSLSCGHEFHRDCIKDWLLRNNTCPICRRPALEK